MALPQVQVFWVFQPLNHMEKVPPQYPKELQLTTDNR